MPDTIAVPTINLRIGVSAEPAIAVVTNPIAKTNETVVIHS
jgi:hypothetical protein